MPEWLKRKILITVKAYPNPSAKHGETVCVAGITEEEGWIRLFPINYRALEDEYRFRKYDLIEIQITKHLQDNRPESYRPNLENLGKIRYLSTTNNWFARKQYVLPTLSDSMCDIQSLQEKEGKSLGVFKVRQVIDLVAEESKVADSNYSFPAQLSFWNSSIKKLEIIPYKFSFKYVCNSINCNGHHQEILDWEIGELYRNLKSKCNNKDEIINKIRNKYINDICSASNDVYFFVGSHSRYPSSFMVLGVFYPKKDSQPSLF